jgi:gluconokinase
LQLVADIFQKKVVVLDNVEGSAWGAVLIAMKSLNIEPKHTFQNDGKEFFPNSENEQTYTVLHAKFERLYEKLKDEF